MSEYGNLSEAFDEMVPKDEPIKGLQKLLCSTFLAGATATLRLLEQGQSLDELRRELECRK